jgi:hypothetical protein
MPTYFNFKETLTSKPKLMTLDEIKRFKGDPNKDYYMSIFSYNDKHKKQVEQTGSIAGIKDVTTNTLVFDFDSKNLEDARQDVLTLGLRLVNEYNVNEDDIACYFSGSKGLHVVVPLSQEITPEQFKQATGKLAEGLNTFDPVVSDPQRVLRLEHTRHPKSGLYKIPLHIAEVEELTIDQIKELAKTPRDDFELNTKQVKLPEILFKVKEKKQPEQMTSDDFDYTNPPKGWKKYKWALAQGWFDSGERHNALMVIAATCRGLGYDKDATYYICKSALKKQAKRTNDGEFDKSELWENIIEKSVFSDSWEGGQYSPQNNPWLKKYCERMNFASDEKEEKVIQLNDIELGFTHYVKNIEQNTILTGIPCLDKAMPLTTGMNLGVIGAASSGKTALALSILKNTSKAGVVSIFASLDMHRNRLFEKLLYKTSGLSRDELYARIKAGEAGPIFQKVREEYSNVYFYDRSAPTVENIREYITQVQEQTGKKVKMVMIDYFERVNSDKSEDTAASKDIAGKLQDLVNDFDICMVTLVQPNKFALSSGPDSAITNYTAIKGSSFLYQSFRSIISIWRPFFNPELSEYDKFLQMAILKNDLGELNMFNFGWHGKKGEIWELAQEGEEELERLLKLKAQSKTNTDSSDDWK